METPPTQKFNTSSCPLANSQTVKITEMYKVKKISSIDLLSFPPVGVYILIAVGAVMMFVGFLGCYGAIQESQCLLGTVSHSLSS